jgi:hypothetical protein
MTRELAVKMKSNLYNPNEKTLGDPWMKFLEGNWQGILGRQRNERRRK